MPESRVKSNGGRLDRPRRALPHLLAAHLHPARAAAHCRHTQKAAVKIWHAALIAAAVMMLPYRWLRLASFGLLIGLIWPFVW